ncbi:MAG: NAD(P)H-dependent oxidoreductase [Cellulophaga sp.]
MNLIKNLEWRYATKKFDATRKVSKEDINKIKRCIQLSASSYGLQLYKVLIIEEKVLREKLKPYAWGQNQITEASHLFVFCNYSKIKFEDVDSFINNVKATWNIASTELQGYGDFIKQKLNEKTEIENANWLMKQTYIALGNLLTACAELKIDSCPMEGFEPDKFNEILGLHKKGLNVSVIATIGYRDNADKTQFLSKVRKPLDDLFIEMKYNE